MKHKISLTVAASLITALLVWALLPTPMDVELDTVRQGRFERAIEEEGKTRLRERYLVSSPVSGRLARLDLKQGDAIEIGATVATLWPSDPGLLDARTRDEQAARVSALEANTARAQTRVASTQAALNQARIDLQRISTLTRQGFVAPSQGENAQLSVTLRDKEHEAAIQDANTARAELMQLRVTMQDYAEPNARRGQSPYAIKAPVAGRVFKVLQTSESVVSAGTLLLELGDPSQLEVEVALLTEDAAQISPGAKVQLLNWGGPLAVMGSVSQIEPAAFTKVSSLGVEEQRVKAIIAIESMPESFSAIGDGFKVDVRVLVQVVENALMVPVSALFPMGARSGLFVFHNGRAVLREVQVQARNGVSAWITTGLAPGSQVIVYPDTHLKNGSAVKARSPTQ